MAIRGRGSLRSRRGLNRFDKQYGLVQLCLIIEIQSNAHLSIA
jgi:hypothetical protein